ncbi:SRPBCC domain-containing protein [Microbispora sp. RL4-1S]|uniref:SRPBCC domain-containing protein n=1 Tax=Microbispora oryzae TaxID=2806554 RepID=A0A941AG19_9ACTN|nr:SRPBCC domain-containing protein [Microbispora oryzae]MBP2702536.1 SRPBCC domain-containing protein [Microbispora oryzae]
MFYSGPSLDVLHRDYAEAGRIDRRAPLVTSSSIVVDAAPAEVWEVLADLRSWPSWASGIRIVELGEVLPGRDFRWKMNGVTLRSRFAVVKPERELTWSGSLLLYRAVDRHVLEPLEDGRTRVVVEESLAGPLLPLLYREATLRSNHERWLGDLRSAVLSRAVRGQARP